MGNRTAIDTLSIIPITEADLERGLTPEQVAAVCAALNLRPLLEALLELATSQRASSSEGSHYRECRNSGPHVPRGK